VYVFFFGRGGCIAGMEFGEEPEVRVWVENARGPHIFGIENRRNWPGRMRRGGAVIREE
jgi:hypothetical protein